MWIGVPVCVIALICSAVSLGIPYWAVYEYLGFRVNYGVFQVCSDLFSCVFTDPTGTMVAVRVLESLGTLLLLLSLILALVKQCSSTNRPTLFKVAGALSIVAAIAIFVGIVIFGAKKELQTTLGTENIDYKFHAGFYIAIVAGALGLIAGILFLIDTVIERHRREDEVLKAGDPVVDWRPLGTDHVDQANRRIITTHSSTQPRSYYSQSGGYYVGTQPHYYQKHYRMKDFAL